MMPWRGLRAALGAVLALLAVLPLHSLLQRPETGLAGAATAAMTQAYTSFVWAGFLFLLIPAFLACRLLEPAAMERAAGRAGRLLTALPAGAFATLAALIAFAAAAGFGALVLHGQPNLIDAMAQLLQARYLAAGHWSGPGPALGAFWQTQQSLFTPHGWVSQYPPGHIVLLTLGLRLHAVWAVGPFMLALTVLFATLAAGRLLPERPAVARLGGLLVAVSPFLIAHAGAYMNHTTAAAFGAFAVWSALRAARGKWLWAVAAGAGVGAQFATRPLSGVTLGITLAVWLGLSHHDAGDDTASASSSNSVSVLAGLALGALPLLLAVAFYNLHFFGSPTRFGYDAALGPAGGLGFGTDPWGNTYGPAQALAYTSAELSTLGLFLLETPLPLVAVIGLFLMFAPRLSRNERLLVAWATLPVAAQLLYWHHGLFMGPRMLNEVAPAWCLLAALAGVTLVERLPERMAAATQYSPRVLGASLLGGALVAGVAALSPLRLVSYAQHPAALDAVRGALSPALVFVHGGWTSRLSMRLAAAGMRLDSVESALRQNPTCAVQQYADAREQGGALPALDFVPRAFPLPQSVEISPGNRIRIGKGESLSGECAREATADRQGTIRRVAAALARRPGRAGRE